MIWTYLDEYGREIEEACDGDERLKNSYGNFAITMADELIIQKEGRYVLLSEERHPPTPYDYQILFFPKEWRDELEQQYD